MTNNPQSERDYETIDTLFQHNLWANTVLFEVCSSLNDEQLDTSIVGTFGSIRETLRHIANAEYSYWLRITTGQPYRRPDDAPPQTVTELQESIHVSGNGLIETAPTVQAQETVEVNGSGTPRAIPKAVILTQAINHATEHRAQIMATLTQLGIQPPDIDGWSYFDAVGSD